MKKRIISLALAVLLLLAVCPAAFAAGTRTFAFDGTATLDKDGFPVITWTDTADRGPYTFSYEYSADSTGKKTLWRAASKISGKSCTVKYLFPGESYNVYVTDRNGDRISGVFTVPANATELRPGPDVVKQFGHEITVPKKGSYLSHFETRYVKSSKGHSIYTFVDTNGNKRGDFYFIPEATEVLALAEQGAYTCVLFTTSDGKLHIGWVNTSMLVYEYP